MSTQRYIVQRRIITGQWRVVDSRDNHKMVGDWYADEEDANRIADACNRAYEEMGREHKSLIARIKEMIAA